MIFDRLLGELLLIHCIEFTQHQRDVFCVFSGNMVSKFRDFLNTSPQFEELRQSFNPGRLPPSIRRPPAPNPRNTGGLEIEGFDDEMADEENDFEDGNEMVVDAQLQNPAFPPLPAVNGHANQTFTSQAIPIPPPIPPLGQHPPTLSPLGQTWTHNLLHPMLGSFTFSSMHNNRPVGGAQPPYTNGATFASVATLAHNSSLRQPNAQNGESSSTGASTATIHRVREDEDGPQDMN